MVQNLATIPITDHCLIYQSFEQSVPKKRQEDRHHYTSAKKKKQDKS